MEIICPIRAYYHLAVGTLNLAGKALQEMQATFLTGNMAWTLSSLVREAAREATGPVEQALTTAISLREGVLKVRSPDTLRM